MARQTSSQCIGPFFHHILIPSSKGRPGFVGSSLVRDGTKGRRIRIVGRIRDGNGKPIEIWQADADGRYRHQSDARDNAEHDENFAGFGRAYTDMNGQFSFETVKPGPVTGNGNALQAPHINVTIFIQGVDAHLFTRLYFADEPEANALDPVLSSVDAERRLTLVATRRDTNAGVVYEFEIRMRGDGETVFFDA